MAAPNEPQLFPKEMLDETGTGIKLAVKYKIVTDPQEGARLKRDNPFVPQLFSVSDCKLKLLKKPSTSIAGVSSSWLLCPHF